jgi:hypothetical protein
LSFALLLCADFNPQSPFAFGFVADASAIIGRPATPMSYAGAARRGVGVGVVGAPVARAAVVTTATVVAVNENEAAQANAYAAAQANAAAGVLEVGAVVAALPAGCNTTKVVNGSSYYYCGGVYYKAGYQSSTLVYVVSAP